MIKHSKAISINMTDDEYEELKRKAFEFMKHIDEYMSLDDAIHAMLFPKMEYETAAANILNPPNVKQCSDIPTQT